MLRVPTDMAEPGMRLARPAHHPAQPGRPLLTRGTELDRRIINRLRELGVRDLWIRYPGLESVASRLNPHILRERRELIGKLSRAFDTVASGSHARIDYADLRGAVEGLLEQLVADPDAAIFMDELAEAQPSLLHRSGSVCFLSLLMGLRLGGYLVSQRRNVPPREAANVVNLGVGAMLHDIGMLRLDTEVIERWSQTQDETDPEWRKHVHLGYDLISGQINATAAAVVLHHHQRFDGSGFPEREHADGGHRGLAGEQIHVFARIVAAADLFERLRQPPSGAEQPPRVRALRRLCEPPHAGGIDPTILRTLVAVAPPYPPGSLVTLTTGEQAVVTDFHPAEPCRPQVRVATDLTRPDSAEAADAPFFDLRQRRDIQIAAVDGQAVLDDNFDLNERLDRAGARAA